MTSSLAIGAVLSVGLNSTIAQPIANTPAKSSQLTLTEQLDLARLVDMAAARLKLNIEYDAAVVKGMGDIAAGSTYLREIAMRGDTVRWRDWAKTQMIKRSNPKGE